MKLRIAGDSLRLRLTRNEVTCLRNNAVVECAIRFSPDRALHYSVASSPEAGRVSVTYKDDSIRVILPQAMAATWAESDEVTIEGSDPGGVQILVEKDFQCLHKPGEPDPQAYPNPFAADG